MLKTIGKQETRAFRWSVGLIVCFTLFLVVWLLMRPGSLQYYVGVEVVVIDIAPLLLLPFCIKGFWQFYRKRATLAEPYSTKRIVELVPLFLCMAVISQSIGESFFIYYYQFLHQAPFPSWEDVGYLSAYPSLLLAVLLLSRISVPTPARIRIFLDGLILMLGVVTCSWYFVLGPTVLQGGEDWFTKVVAVAYPLGDLVLIFCLILLSLRVPDKTLKPVVIILSLAIVANVFADSSYSYRILQGASTVGAITDVGWVIGYMLYGLGAQVLLLLMTQQSPLNKASSQAPSLAIPQGWFAVLPYVLVLIVGALFVYTQSNEGDSPLRWGVYIGGITLIGLVLLRQFFAVQETIFYNKELQRVQQELHEKNYALSDANTQLEQQAVQVQAAFEQQRQLNELKDQFLLNVNHELRTPLTALHGYLSLLQEFRGQLNDELQAKFIGNAIISCEGLQNMVNNILNAIRGDLYEKSLQLTDISVATAVHEVLDIFEPQKRQEFSLQLDIAQTLTVRADRQHLHQVLLNLLSNAFKYSPPHTTIVISAKLSMRPSTTSREETSIPQQVCISVQDAGPGIPPAELPLLFEKFVRLKRDLGGSVRGTGLGLYISKQLVEAMGGRMWVESSGIPGQGSRFYFTLPAVIRSSIES